ncbi:M36 family metallopeptidase [Hymenobacter sp. AT01-02]
MEFDFAFTNGLTTAPTSNLNLAVVNLFYWNNMIHDVMATRASMK